MKSSEHLAVISLVALLCAARAAVLDVALPEPSAFADTEADCQCGVSIPRRSVLSFRLDCATTSTNCAEIVLGRDSNLDGELDWSESEIKFGWDAGSWSVSSPKTGEELFDCLTPGGSRGSLRATMRVDSRGRAASLAFRSGDSAVLLDAAEIAATGGDVSMWNLMRVVTRGNAGTMAVRATSRRDGSMVFVK